VLVAVIVLQFLWVLFTADKNPALLSFGAQLSTFVYQIYHYLTFNTEQRPFPFSDWPTDVPLSENEQADDTEMEVETTEARDVASESDVELADKA